MDPNATLVELRSLAGEVLVTTDEGVHEQCASRMAELFQALDEWLAKGGFVPEAWSDARIRTVQHSNYLPPSPGFLPPRKGVLMTITDVLALFVLGVVVGVVFGSGLSIWRNR